MAKSSEIDKSSTDKHKELIKKLDSFFSIYGDAISKGNGYRKFGYGNQWSAQDETDLNGRDMTTLTNNLLAKHYKKIFGEFAANVPELSLKSMGSYNNADDVENMAHLLQQRLSVSDSERSISKSFEEKCRTGLFSGLYVYTEYKGDSFEQEVYLEYIDYGRLFFDPNAQHPTKKDGRWIGYLSALSKDEYEERFGTDTTDVPGLNEQFYKYNHVISSESDSVMIFTIFIREASGQRKKVYLTKNGEVIEDKKSLKKGDSIKDTRDIQKTIIRKYVGNGKEILETEDCLYEELPISVDSGYHAVLDGEIFPYPLGYEVFDLQKMENLSLSQIDSAVRNLRKETLVIDQQSIQNSKASQDAILDPLRHNGVWVWDSKVGQPPVRMSPDEMPSTLIGLYEQIQSNIDATMGIYDAAQGAPSNEVSGIAQALRIGQNNIGIYYYIDNTIECLKQVGRILVNVIPQIYVEEREVGKGNGSLIINPKFNYPDIATLDMEEIKTDKLEVDITVSTSFEVQTQQNMNLLIQLIQLAPEKKDVLIPMLVEMSRLPQAPKIISNYEKMTALTNPNAYAVLKGIPLDKIEEKQEQQQQQAQQIQGAVMQSKMQAIQSKVKGQQVQNQISAGRLNIDQQKLQLDQSRHNAENLQNLSQYQMDGQKLESEMQESSAKIKASQTKSRAEIINSILGLLEKIS